MSEKAPKFEYSVENHKIEGLSEQAGLKREQAASKAEVLDADKAHARVEKALKHQEKPLRHKAENHAGKPHALLHSSFKDHTFRQTLVRTRKKLSRGDRAFSKFVHKPLIENTSELAGATVARPSGLLVGGLFSLVSSLSVLYICRHYGYEYNYAVGMASFAGGFALGLLLEGFGKAFSR